MKIITFGIVLLLLFASCDQQPKPILPHKSNSWNLIFNNQEKMVIVLNPSDCIPCIFNLWNLNHFIKNHGYDSSKIIYVIPEEVKQSLVDDFLKKIKVDPSLNIIHSDSLVDELRPLINIKLFSSFYLVLDSKNNIREGSYLHDAH